MPSSHERGTSPRRRSRSPHRDARSRSRSPQRETSHRHHHRKHRVRSPVPSKRRDPLPYNAQRLSKHQYAEYRPLFSSYLDIQKNLHLDDIEEREARGRWKSFVSRWNCGELARSWYDPSMLKTARETISATSDRRPSPERKPRASPDLSGAPAADGPELDSQSDDDFGPAAPKHIELRRTGPTMPHMDDLALRDEERARDGSHYRDDIRYERKLDRTAQKARLDELAPRADAGSRERMLEKKRETTTTLKGFRDAKENGDIEVAESDLMGDDGIETYKRDKTDMERKKNEREIRKEEIQRARNAELEERLSEIRQKEAATMDYLKAIAKDRFG